MIENRIYTEAFISKSLVGSGWETDSNGNPIVIIEASNENLDYAGEVVLRSALMSKVDYFLKNGVISYDHKHLFRDNDDPEWTAEKYIIGKPLDAWEGTDINGEPVVKVKAVLSRSNEIAKQIIVKLKDGLGTVKASVGGRRAMKQNVMNTKTFKDVPTIVGVDWDEVALTHKPVNQTLGQTTLCPIDFVKSLTAGGSANPGDMGNGGNALQGQSLETDPIKCLMMKLRNREINKSSDAITHLVDSGYSEKKAKTVLKMIIDNNYLGDIIMAKANDIEKVVSSSTDELKKALDNMGAGDDLVKGLANGTKCVVQNGHLYKAIEDGKKTTYEKMDADSPDYNSEDDEDDEDDDEKDEDDLEKSLNDEFYDVTQDVVDMKKSLKTANKEIKALTGMVKSLVSSMPKQEALLKSMATVALETDTMIKSISGAPLPRRTGAENLIPVKRYTEDMVKSLSQVTIQGMTKSLLDAGVDATTRGQASLTFRRNGIQGVAQMMPNLIPTILGKKE